MKEVIKENRMDRDLNVHKVSEVWSAVTGAGRYTIDVTYSKGTLYCTLNSSMARNELYFQKDAIVKEINSRLKDEVLFVWDWEKGDFVKNIVLR